MKEKLAWQLAPQIPIMWFLLMLSAFAHGAENDVRMLVIDQTPYGFKNDKGINTGVLLDLMKEIHDDSGVGSAVQTLPLKRLLATLQLDIKSCALLANSPFVNDNFDLLEPIGYKLRGGVLPLAAVELKDYFSLTGKVIAVPLGVRFDNKFHNDSSLNKLSAPRYINAIKMMKRGRVDAVAGAIPVLRYLAGKEGINIDFFGRPLILVEKNIYLACSFKLTKHERNKLQQAVISLKSSGKVQQIFDNYPGLFN
ncbi:MAG: hypothetical protein OFPI_32800 [Osedax symbiont Rs2]|nr:MAG: hypothetical protein OFPI_32800 [Osedax symbiont Rs2]